MEMLKILTQKLKQQSLNEVQPFQSSEVEDDRDSGTESDEENAELEALEREMLEQQENQENESIPCPMQIQSPPHCLSPVMYSLSKKPLQLANHPASPFCPSIQRADLNFSSYTSSPQGSSDFERCSLDYDPSSSTEFDRHSSEEELAFINYPSREVHREKRTWSQANRCGSCQDSSGSSDEEVKDLMSKPQPVLFSSSPPRGVQKLSKTLSPRLFLANVTPTLSSSVSPRKRHRQTSDSDSPTVIQRPCLDFEKMQRTLLRRQVQHGINKARIVKIKLKHGCPIAKVENFTNTGRPPKCLYDPSVFAFRSISTAYSPLTPVEEPSCAY